MSASILSIDEADDLRYEDDRPASPETETDKKRGNAGLKDKLKQNTQGDTEGRGAPAVSNSPNLGFVSVRTLALDAVKFG